MRCIFCLREREPSDEHVFPEAIGGTLKIDRVCKCCNSRLGSKIDAPLVNSWPVQLYRQRLNISGGSKSLPNAFKDGVLVDFLEQKIHVDYDPASNEWRMKSFPVMKAGLDGEIFEITIDQHDTGKPLDHLIQKGFQKQGLAKHTDAQIASIKQALLKQAIVTEIDSPVVQHEKKIDFSLHPRALTKIAHELAWYWFGDAYLEDTRSTALRHMVGIDTHGQFLDQPRPVDGSFEMWPRNQNSLFTILGSESHHLGFAMKLNSVIAIGVRVFDYCSLFIVVTAQSERYPNFEFGEVDGPCVLVNASEPRLRETTIAQAIESLFPADV
jgi:HNH endonuclease